MDATREIHVELLGERVSALPALEELRAAASPRPIYLVGGAVRDLLLGSDRVDVDVVVEGDATEVASALGGEVRSHDRFGTATAFVDGIGVDLATARRESYARPGALPDVAPASISEDLARRDFTINAMAVPLDRPPVLIDPFGGAEDLRRGVLRTLHEGSFADDPTRALRAARYAARLDLELDPQTEVGLLAADLESVSEDRVRAELRKLAAERDAARGFALLDGWGLIAAPEGAAEVVRRTQELLESTPWAGTADRAEAVLAAATAPSPEIRSLGVSRPDRASEIARLAGPRTPVELVVARARGADWLDRWIEGLRDVRLQISGADLVARGVPEGPAVGRALAAALAARLDGAVSTAEGELEVALADAGLAP